MTLAAPGDGSHRRERAEQPVAVEQAGDDGPRELLARAGIATSVPRPAIVVCGGAGELRGPQLARARAILAPAVGAAVAGSGAAVVDGGTDAGVMALLGEERARDPAALPLLVGVAPVGRVGSGGDDRAALDPHHSHVVLADSDEWGGETPLLIAIAEELAGPLPIVMVLAGGGEVAMAEVKQALRHGWPLFAIEGTGGVADEIVAACAGRSDDATLRARLEAGDVRPVAADGPDALAAMLASALRDEQGPRDKAALEAAWRMFATYDSLAVRLRRSFERTQLSILVLGAVATAIALAHEEIGSGVTRDVLHWGAVLAPVVVSVLVALANRRGAGKRWVALRAAAEAVKSEIYRYRTRTGAYSRTALRRGDGPAADRPRRLARRLTEIESGLVLTAASGGALPPYDGPVPPKMFGAEAADDGFAWLDAPRYLAIRVGDQLSYYRARVRRLDRLRGRLQLVTLAAGGLGALLAAAGFEIWIGLTTAIAGGALAHLGYLQVDNTIVGFNAAIAGLAALERDDSVAATSDLEDVVEGAETILTTELGGWVQQMTEALADLQERQREASSKSNER